MHEHQWLTTLVLEQGEWLPVGTACMCGITALDLLEDQEGPCQCGDEADMLEEDPSSPQEGVRVGKWTITSVLYPDCT